MNSSTKKNQIINIFLLLFLFIAGLVHSQTYNFTHYSLKDGLIQSNVNDILQDKQGYIWFATDGGLSKFNGQTFTNYSTNDGLGEASVNSICEDNKGQLWIGHSLGKLSLYDGKKFSNFNLKIKDKPIRICDISKDKTGSLWISTIGSGALYFNPSTNRLKQYSIKEKLSDVVFMSFTDASGKTWFVTDIGIKYFDPEKDNFIHEEAKIFRKDV
jgi:ligand-binding sensor domain-containing protein